MTAPARGYSWPPFESGNLAAFKHGAYSPRFVDPLAGEIVAEIAQDIDWWRGCDQLAVRALARVEAQAVLLYTRLHEGDESVSVQWLKTEARAESMRARLGLDPQSRFRMGRDVAAANVDLATVGFRRLLRIRSSL